MFYLQNPVLNSTGKCSSGVSSSPYGLEELRTSFTKQRPECQMELEMEDVFSAHVRCCLVLSEQRINPG